MNAPSLGAAGAAPGAARADSPAGAGLGETVRSPTPDSSSTIASHLEAPGVSPIPMSTSMPDAVLDVSPAEGASGYASTPALLQQDRSHACGIPLSASARPSGIKPPSRIARPCSVAPKPALPAAAISRANGSAATTRRLGDETPPRRRIAGARAAGDQSSIASAGRLRRGFSLTHPIKASSSAGDGWASARRLGEAGVRRSSDTSVVLTEDTDSFIIGDRVWVGGTKPGKIAYIGATQFAPGEWAGVVLDDPVGKNDGSVAGIRYFQCEARRGVFSRLTRLTRAPLPAESPLGLLGANGSVSGASSPSRPHSAIVSPASSINNLSQRSSKSSTGGYKVGDRVIVMSSMGSKAGVLRYLGTTDFATGEWCGVELDDPLGKNDGAVAGRRYFECQPKFGLFAPSHKVSKSPSSRRPSAACALHHPNSQNSNLPVMKRGGSRESLASSVASSAVSSVRGARVRLGVTSLQKTGVRTPTNPAATRASLQDTLKEKDAQIERLLQERKLDRAEVIRAATQLEDAESKLSLLKQEFDKCQGNADTKLREMQDLLARVHQEKADLATQLDDEKRKIEDLQFRFEEESITKGDIEVTSAEQAENIARLEEALATERARADALERDATALFEAEESTARLREEHERLAAKLREVEAARDAAAHAHAAEAEALRKQLQHAGDGANSLAVAATKADHEHRATVETLLNEKEAIRSELTSQLKETIASHTEEITQSRKQLKEIEETLNAQLTASSQRCTGLEEQLASIVKQLEDAQNIIRLKSDDLEKGSEATKAIEMLLKSQVEETRNALSVTTEELKKVKNSSLEKDQQLDQLKTSLAKAENDVKAKSLELDTLIESTEKQLAEIQMKAEETQVLLCQKSEELTLTSKASDEKIAQKNDTLNKMEEKCKVQEVEIAELQQKLKELKDNYEMTEQESQTTRAKILEERNANLSQLEAAISEKDIIVMKLQSEMTQHSKETKEKDILINKHIEELTGLNEKLCSVEAARTTLNENVQHLELEVGDLKRNLKAAEEKVTEANAQKQKLEQDICELMSTSSDSSLQLNKLNSELREKEHELEKVKEQTSVSIREKEAICQKLEQTIEQATRAQRELEDQIEQIKKEASEAEKIAAEKLKDASERQQQLGEQLMENQKKINTLELESREHLSKVDQEFEAAKEEFAKKTQKSQENYQELEQQLSKLRKEVTAREVELNQEIAVLSAKLQSAEDDMKQKSSKLSLSEEEMKTKVEKMLEVGKKLEENLKQSHQLEIEALKSQLISAENAVLEKDAKMSSITDELTKLKQEKDLLECNLVEKDSKLIDTLKEQQRINELKSQAESTLLEKSRDIDELTNHLNKEKLKSADLEKQIINSHDEQKILQQEFEDTKAEKCRMENLIKITETELSKLSEEFSILKEAHSSRSLSSAENEAKLRNLMQEVADLTREKGSVEEKLRETSEMLVDATTQLAALAEEKVLLLKVSEELENLKITFDQHKNELSGQLQETKKEAELVPLLKESLEKEKEKSNELETKLSSISKVHSELSDRCIQLEKSACTLPTLESQVSTLEKELEKVLNREDESKKLYECEKAELLKTIEAVQKLLSQKEKESQAQKLESTRLAEEIAKAQQYKKVLEKLEIEKEELKHKVSKMTVSAAESQANANSSDSSYVKLIEEKELAQSQIDFLNSVIVDMQQKNVALKTRLEVLEMGILPSDANDLIEEGITKRVIAPRLFCDICGEFDLHDTEDCPRQATESPTPPTNNSKHAVGARSNIQERPYCEICETFGHSTEDCDDAETF